jgi:hypothetical protein
LQTGQEVLAFEPSVLCVVALYIALDGVEAGYHEKNEDKILSSNPAFPISKASTHSEDKGLCLDSRLLPTGREPVSMPSPDLNNTEGPWIWRWVDINDTMDQVCRTTQVSGVSQFRHAFWWIYHDWAQTSWDLFIGWRRELSWLVLPVGIFLKSWEVGVPLSMKHYSLGDASILTL